MVPCIAIGDSLAVGIAQARPECVMAASAGISSIAYAASHISSIQPSGSAIISLGLNDGAGAQTAESLRQVRRAVTAGAVIWLIPNASVAVRAAVATVAGEWHDRIIDIRPLVGPDGIHPANYEALAEQTRSMGAPSTPLVRDSMAELLMCGPTVEPSTLRAIMRVESDGQPLSINVNGLSFQPAPARSVEEATAIAEHWIARGYSVDLGLMQVNNRNLRSLGYSVAQMFDPCTNIQVGASILTASYLSAMTIRSDPQTALRAALSAYNTGNFESGFYNGYVAKYYGPNSDRDRGMPVITASAFPRARPTLTPINPYTAAPTVYHRSSNDG